MLLASFFLPSHLSFKNMYMYMCLYIVYTVCHSPSGSDSTAEVKQTAALCLLKLLRMSPKAIPIDQHAARIVQLLNDRHLVHPVYLCILQYIHCTCIFHIYMYMYLCTLQCISVYSSISLYTPVYLCILQYISVYSSTHVSLCTPVYLCIL